MSLSPRDLRGCMPAIVTPMSSDGSIDLAATKRLVEGVLDAGVTGIVIAGTTGQSSTLSHEEHVLFVRVCSNYARHWSAASGRAVKVIASAGSNATEEALELTRRICEWCDVDGLLHLSGYYNNPPQEGLLKHFKLVADAAAEYDAGVVLYNVPSRTCCNLEAATVIELAAHPAIVGIKEASGNLEQVQAILDGTSRDDLSVVSGEDHLVAEIIRRGGSGVIAASGNLWPHEFQRMCELALAGEHDKAAELQQALMVCVKAVFSAKNPIPLHHMLGTNVRLPLVMVEDLRPAARDKVLAACEEALAITHFPHCEPHRRVQLSG